MHSVGIELYEVFGALADPIRIRIIRLLLETNGEACLCELSDSLDEPEYKLSRHVKVLKFSGLITSIRDGKWVYHGLVKDMNYLKAIHKAVQVFPDSSKNLGKDLMRFKRRLDLRENGRCRTGTQSIQRSGKSAFT